MVESSGRFKTRSRRTPVAASRARPGFLTVPACCLRSMWPSPYWRRGPPNVSGDQAHSVSDFDVEFGVRECRMSGCLCCAGLAVQSGFLGGPKLILIPEFWPGAGNHRFLGSIWRAQETPLTAVLWGAHPALGPGFLGRFWVGFGRPGSTCGPKSGPKRPGPKARAVWDRFWARI